MEKEVVAEKTDDEVMRYIRGLGIISSDSESARTYYHYVSDNQGSVRLILTDTANDRRLRNYYCYDAFGESIISHEDVHNRFRFNGEQYDSVTSQYYLRARFYNPVIGRFTQEDTYYGDGLNLYEYCRNNPVLYRDPSGHDAVNQENLYGSDSGTRTVKDGATRAAQFSSEWGYASLQEVINRFAPNVEPIITTKGKIIYNNTETGISVVYDKMGNYFRIEDTTRPRGRNYLDTKGNDMNNETGRNRSDYQKVTHFNNTDKG